MAQDEYIEQRLRQWADWLVQRESGGLGFPSECSYTRMQQRSGTGGCISPDVDIEAMQMEDAVRDLPDYLRETVRSYYVDPGTVDQKVQHLRCGRRALFYRITAAQEKIKSWLERCSKKSS